MTSDALHDLPNEPDLGERIRHANRLLKDHQQMIAELGKARRQWIDEYRIMHGGLRQIDLATQLGMNRGLISQLEMSKPSPARTILGGGTGSVVVALGSRTHADAAADDASPEFRDVYVPLADLARELGLKVAKPEHIPSSGTVNLNQKNLVVACGPGLSGVIATVLQSDPHLRFEHGENDGWSLKDVTADRPYPSPRDAKVPVAADIGYLGRLPRPDRKGNFLCIAGIHTTGTKGIVHFLQHGLEELHERVGRRRFSALVRSEYDPPTEKILYSELVVLYTSS